LVLGLELICVGVGPVKHFGLKYIHLRMLHFLNLVILSSLCELDGNPSADNLANNSLPHKYSKTFGVFSRIRQLQASHAMMNGTIMWNCLKL